MAIKPNREYRNFQIIADVNENVDKDSYKVRGYASTFDEYTLLSYEGVDYKERIEPTAFEGADMSDVIFLYNHDGMVYARQKNGTLTLSTDSHGLFTEADLSSTKASRELFEAIQAGLVDQMSFAFSVAEDDYDFENHTRIIKRFEKIYDVSAVSIPANPGTDIAAVSARDYFDGVIEAEKAERLEREKQLALAKAKFNFMEV